MLQLNSFIYSWAVLLIILIKSIMQVISSRVSSTPRSSSTQRTARKGISLASQSKCNSLPKSSQQFFSHEQSQPYHHLGKQTRLSCNLGVVPSSLTQPPSYISNHPSSYISSQPPSYISPQPSSFICPQPSSYISSQPSVAVEKSITEMPKITFHYTSQPLTKPVNLQRVNPFFAQNPYNYIPQQTNRGRFLPCQQLRNVVITTSVETKNLSRYKVNSDNALQLPNQKKTLIDSRRVDRQIIQQEIYQNMPTLKPNTVDSASKPFQSQISSIDIESKIQFNRSSQKTIEKQFVEQPPSPYCQLLSTAKKCEGKNFSPYASNSGQKNNLMGTPLLKKIDEIQQFNINGIVLEENQQESAPNSRVLDSSSFEVDQKGNEKQTSFQDLKQRSVSVNLQQKRSIQLLRSGKSILENKEMNIYQKKNSSSPQNVSSFKKESSPPRVNLCEMKSSPQKGNQGKKKSSPQKSNSGKKKQIVHKVSAQKQSVLADIQNKPPEIHHQAAISGRRNVKRFREIEKRLEEIITICNSNL